MPLLAPLSPLAAGTDFPPVRKKNSRSLLLQGASIGALLVAGSAAPARAGGPFKSLAQGLAQMGRSAPAAVSPSAATAASQQANLGAQNLTRAATRFKSLAAALAQAESGTTSSGSPIVVDGYGPGDGLQAAPGAVAGGSLWQGAALPQSSGPAANGAVTVTVTQNAPLAQLTWKTFNVGAKTTLDFDQSAGGTLASSWVVINTVQDPQADGSLILGAIDATGKVYVLNRNGIAFGAGSTINVGSLIAATADIAATQFATTASGITSFNLYGAQTTTTSALTGVQSFYAPTFIDGIAGSSVTVAAGADIQTAAPTGNNGGGYVMLLGGNVSNAGVIGTPQGQTVLAAGTAFTLRQGSTGSTTSGNTVSTTLGSEVAATNIPVNPITGQPTADTADALYVSGSVSNSGMIVADQGDISLIGHALSQSGVLLSTTTVNTRGTIHLLTPTDGTDPTASITLAPNSVTEILPEDDGLTALDSQRAADQAASVLLNAQRETDLSTNPRLNNSNALPDQVGESRVEISTGGSVDVQSGALVQTPGGQIAVGGGSSVLVESGATLDVSGSTDAVLPASVNDLLVNVQPFQLRDSAANRTGGLKGTNAYVDARTLLEIASGAYAGNIYTPGGLLEVSGYLGLVPHGIDEWTAIGGQVTLQAVQTVLDLQTGKTSTVSGAVITDPGSMIDMQGGTVTYAAGPVAQSYVQTTDGVVYNINDAPGNLVYTGLYVGDVVQHPRWKITNTYSNALLTPATIVDPSYIVGRDAGTLTVNAATLLLQGSVAAGVTLGTYQDGPRPADVTDPYLLAQTVVPQAGSLLIGNYVAGLLQPGVNPANPTNVTFQATQGPAYTPASGLAAALIDSAIIDSAALNQDGLANLVVTTAGSITVSAPIEVADGGSVSLTGATIDLNSGITAHAGQITITDVLNGEPIAPNGAITLHTGATLDTSGVWTNAHLDPVHLAGLGFANGGTVTIASAGGVVLETGSTINVASGGGILPNGTLQSATGGSVSVTADVIEEVNGPTSVAPISFDSQFIGNGENGGGTLSLTAPVLAVGPAIPVQQFGAVLDPSLFSSGFSNYVVNGTAALTVAADTQITVAEPIYTPAGAASLPSGGDPADAYKVTLPVLYLPTRGTDSLSQRRGASISLLSTTDPGAPASGIGGSVTIGAGAGVTVDPGQSITVAGFGQVTILGTLTAHGGSINVANTSFNPFNVAATPIPSTYQPGVSVWLGAGSLLDVSGLAVTDTDDFGRSFGLAASGGTITLGGDLAGGSGQSTWGQVIVRPGAVLDADGAQATVDIVPGTEAGTSEVLATPVTLAGNGGTISARSLTGIALDGSLSAQAGGTGAAGGALSLQLDPVNLAAFSNIPTYVYQPREILVSQTSVPVQNDPALQPGDISPAATFGLVRVSQQQIDAGGFDALSLTAQAGEIVFAGNVDLHATRSISLSTGVLGDSAGNAAVGINSAVVSFAGFSQAATPDAGTEFAPIAPVVPSFSTLTVNADLIDFSDLLDLGGTELVSPASTTVSATPGFGAPHAAVDGSALSFAMTNFNSAGDIRFLGSTGPNVTTGQLLTFGNITFTAAQLYPTSGLSATGTVSVQPAQMQVVAGYNPLYGSSGQQAPLSNGGTILVQGLGGAAPQAPYSVGGHLTLIADDIIQQGIIRAPEGVITFSDGDVGNGIAYPSSVTLAPGSITSVSLYGQTIPYGGTVDGVTYTAPGGATAQSFSPEVEIQAQSVDVEDGATIDLRGGGTLSGAGFVFGRGGTADVLTTPLLNVTGGAAVAASDAQVTAVQPVNTGDPVYAILPSYQSAYAPAVQSGDSAYSATIPGEQITVGNEIPGLAAGTYTLLPAYYALLPGAFRVELTSGAVPAGSNLSRGNFTSVAPVTLSIANTGIAAAVPSAALFTSGTNVRQLSQYDEQTYNDFEVSAAAQFDAPRPFLPQDAKTLLLSYPSTIGTGTALSFAPSALLKTPDTANGGYGMTLEIDTTATIVINGPGDTASGQSLVLQDSTLSALDVPRLVLGGTLSADFNSPTTIDINGDAAAVIIQPHADLTAGDILITTANSGEIVVQNGGTISTIGAGPAAYDAASGYFFSNQAGIDASGQVTADPVLDISNGQVAFVPNTDTSVGAAITIGDNSAVLAGGSLNIVAPASTVVTVGDAILGAKYATIAVSAINIGTEAALAADAGQLPAGIDFTAASLASLLNGDPALGTPAATELTLTATQEVNILGSVQLNTGSTDLVLNTPAIYGIGTATDQAVISAPNFTWNGVATQNATNVGPTFAINASALPGAQIAQGLQGEAAGTPSGTLAIEAGTITLGYAPQTQANDQLQLDRLIAGFGNVVLQASQEITANNQSSLSVYAQQTTYGQPGLGGNLSLLAPLVTTDDAAVLKLTAGGALTLAPGAATPAATGTVSTLGGEIDLTATSVGISTSVALPAGALTIVAQNGITFGAGSTVDLAGRATPLLDKTVFSEGGTLSAESTAGTISLDAAGTAGAASLIDVSSPGAAAGGITLSALAGEVVLDGDLRGAAPSGQTGGSFTVLAGTLTADAAATAGTAFDTINETLNNGGFTASRSFEFSALSNGIAAGNTANLLIDNAPDGTPILAAQDISVTADAGSIDIAGTVDASGAGPGSITLQAQQNLTLETTALLDAHATATAVDSNGQPIDAENRAHVTLTATAGTLTLNGGTVDLSYPDQKAEGAQGQLVLDAPRSAANDDVAINAAAPITVSGAQSIALYAWKTYVPTDPDGTIAQLSSDHPHGSPAVLGLDTINADSVAFMTAAGESTGLAARLAGLAAYGSLFHLRPGVEIDSSAATGNNLTISGDLDLSEYRYSDVGYGTAVTPGIYGSGEAGAIVFRAKNDLIVNGSVTDGFERPPDSNSANYINADNGWAIISKRADPLNADVFLPSSITAYTKQGAVIGHQVELAKNTTFDETRPISLNYAITIKSAEIGANTVIPFSATLADAVTVPQGGFVTSAPITTPSAQVIAAGTFLAGGTTIAAGSVFAAHSTFPVPVVVPNKTLVPAGTLLSIFDDADPNSPTGGTPTLTLAADTGILPDNAFIPSNTTPIFVTASGEKVFRLAYRLENDIAGNEVQGYLYALSALLPAGSQSWDMGFVSGANLHSANRLAVQPRSVLDGGALAPAASTDYAAPGSLILDDQHYVDLTGNVADANPAFSVIRTGTGDLDLVAGGDFDQSSLYGIYTAGTPDPLPGGPAVNQPYDLKREGLNGQGGNVVQKGDTAINRIIQSTYRANYPNDGGDVLLSAQGSVTGDLYGGGGNSPQVPSDAIGNWLWRQGSTQLGPPTAWWINFGTFVTAYGADDTGYNLFSTLPQLVGFQGIGSLGGGNVTVIAGTDAGQTTDRQGANADSELRGEGLVIAVASTGREVSVNGISTIVSTGGGDLTLHVGGTLNPIDAQAYGLSGSGGSTTNGALIDLRGDITVTAGAIGRDDTSFPITPPVYDPRPADPDTPTYTASDGITIVPGDGSVTIDTMRDLVLDGIGDAGRVTEQNLTYLTHSDVGSFSVTGGDTGFTLWTPDTSVTLFSAGGNVTPVTAPALDATLNIVNDGITDGRLVVPSQLYVTAATGDIVYGDPVQGVDNTNYISLEVMPSANEQVAFLAGTSIVANDMAVDLSGADPSGLSTPLNPAFTSDAATVNSSAEPALSNIRAGGGTTQSPLALFALTPDTPTDAYLSTVAASTPALFYAANGDIVNFITGETLTFPTLADETLPQWYLAAKPVWIKAGRDIVSTGTRPSAAPGSLQQNQQDVLLDSGLDITSSGDLFLNDTANSVSIISAGRDILSAYAYVGGPGLLEVDAGRNIDQIGSTANNRQVLEYGSIKSLGSLETGAPVSLSGGAGVSILAGIGTGADYAAFAELYLDPANQANLALPITDPANQGKVQQSYSSALLTWLQQNYGYTGTQAGALAYFLDPADVPLASQDAFLRDIFFNELLASGQQYNDPTSRFYRSYVRGRQAITALLPGQNGQTTPTSGAAYGDPQGYDGAITMQSGTIRNVSGLFDAGVATEHGGDIDVIDAGGQVELGTAGEAAPGGGTGLITNGAGNIDVFAKDSVLLGKSRIFTNAGGNIQIWSAEGDINAGIGARTSVVYDPPIISYDDTGGLVETPGVPTSGAGIATEQPLPSIPAGNIDLTAPLGTIDAGEAGVRSSGNLNLAAARLANTAGFSAGGKTTGTASAPSVSLGAIEAAGAAAGAATSSAQSTANNAAQAQQPSIIEVEILSIGAAEDDLTKRRKKGP